LKNGEVRKEEKIQRVMCEGVCNKCREKSQWRFKYNKYKPLKTPASCRDCNMKVVHKAYRALCDGCATKRKVCSSCSKDLDAANLEYSTYHRVKDEDAGETSIGTKGMVVSGPQDFSSSIVNSSIAGSSTEMEEEEDVGSASKKSKNDHESSAHESDNLKSDELKGTESVVSNVASGWDERKFNTIANLKYSKDRVVGSAEDGSGGASTVFCFSK
jgi:Uncharacterized conserved protein (DUF2039)